MAVGIRITKITPVYPYQVYLQWDVSNPEISGSYTFVVSRSASSEGPWDTLIDGAQNIYNYIDDLRNQTINPTDGKIHLFSLQRQIYYRVQVIPPNGCAYGAISDPHPLMPELAPLQAGLRRRLQHDERIIFARLNGVRIIVLKRRFWGVRCPDCYDPITRGLTREQCLTCYSTGFTGGYWDPVVTFGRVNTPINVNVQTTERGVQENAPHVVTLLDIPLIQDKDLIIEAESNTRHIVRHAIRTELRRQSVHQQAQTTLLEHNAVEYHIPVDLRAIPPIL